MEEKVQNPNHSQNNIDQNKKNEEDKMEILDSNFTSKEKPFITGFVFDKNFFVDRSFHEVDDGNYDEEGFYHTPEGSFWNDEQDYFNRYGYDKYGGKYNLEGLYIPGEGWDSDLQCYKEDLDEEFLEKKPDEINDIIAERFQTINNVCDISISSDVNGEDLSNEEKEKIFNDFLNVKEVIREEIEELSQRTGMNIKEEEIEKELAPLYYENNINAEINDKEIDNNNNDNDKHIEMKPLDEEQSDFKNDFIIDESKQVPFVSDENLVTTDNELEVQNKIESKSKIVKTNILFNSQIKSTNYKNLGEEKNQKIKYEKENDNTNTNMILEKSKTPAKSLVNSKNLRTANKSVSKINNI